MDTVSNSNHTNILEPSRERLILQIPRDPEFMALFAAKVFRSLPTLTWTTVRLETNTLGPVLGLAFLSPVSELLGQPQVARGD